MANNVPPKLLLLTWGEFDGDTISRFISKGSNGNRPDITSIPIMVDGKSTSTIVSAAREEIGNDPYDAVAVVCKLPLRSHSDSENYFDRIHKIVKADALKQNTIILFTNWDTIFRNNSDFQERFLDREIKKNAKFKNSLAHLVTEVDKFMLFNPESHVDVQKLKDVIDTFKPGHITNNSGGSHPVVLGIVIAALLFTIIYLWLKPPSNPEINTGPDEVKLRKAHQLKRSSDRLESCMQTISDVEAKLYRAFGEQDDTIQKQTLSWKQFKRTNEIFSRQKTQMQIWRKMLTDQQLFDIIVDISEQFGKHRAKEYRDELAKAKSDNYIKEISLSPLLFLQTNKQDMYLKYNYVMHRFLNEKKSSRKCPKNPRKRPAVCQNKVYILKGTYDQWEAYLKLMNDNVDKIAKEIKDEKKWIETMSEFIPFLKKQVMEQLELG